MFLTCADSRVNPNLVTQTNPGEIFIERNPGNMVPPYVEFVGGVTAGVEYAMLVLKVPVIVVCGHNDCGVMKALLYPERVHEHARRSALDESRHTLPVSGCCGRSRFARREEQLQRLTEYNVLEQIEHLQDPSQRSLGDMTLRRDSRFAAGCTTSAADQFTKPMQPRANSSLWA